MLKQLRKSRCAVTIFIKFEIHMSENLVKNIMRGLKKMLRLLLVMFFTYKSTFVIFSLLKIHEVNILALNNEWTTLQPLSYHLQTLRPLIYKTLFMTLQINFYLN